METKYFITDGNPTCEVRDESGNLISGCEVSVNAEKIEISKEEYDARVFSIEKMVREKLEKKPKSKE